MNTSQAKKLVVLSTVGTLILASIAAARQSGGGTVGPRAPRILVGSLIVGVLLAGTAEAAPKIAGGLAAVMLMTTATYTGADAWNGIADAVRPGGGASNVGASIAQAAKAAQSGAGGAAQSGGAAPGAAQTLGQGIARGLTQ